MKLHDKAVTLQEFQAMINSFISEECKKSGGHLVHTQCGGAIKVGFANLFFQNTDGSLDPGIDGFGIGSVRVPYCEKCDPPNGFNYTYTRRVGVARDKNKKPKQ